MGGHYFAGALGRGGSSPVSGANLLTKVYLPRLVIPVSGPWPAWSTPSLGSTTAGPSAAAAGPGMAPK